VRARPGERPGGSVLFGSETRPILQRDKNAHCCKMSHATPKIME
jgi:hypothetical protein